MFNMFNMFNKHYLINEPRPYCTCTMGMYLPYIFAQQMIICHVFVPEFAPLPVLNCTVLYLYFAPISEPVPAPYVLYQVSNCFAFQFNFKFDIETDMYAEESISLLQVTY